MLELSIFHILKNFCFDFSISVFNCNFWFFCKSISIMLYTFCTIFLQTDLCIDFIKFLLNLFFFFSLLSICFKFPQDIEILGWRPAGPVLPHGEKVPLALVGHPSSDGVTIKMSYGVDVLHRPASHPIFSYWLVKTESGFTVRSVETSLGKWTLVVVVISVDAYHFLAYSDLTCHLEDTRIGVFWLHCATWW